MRKERTVVDVLDDLDKETPAENYQFALDGKTYEIDLADQHYRDMQDALAAFELAQGKLQPFLKAARPVERRSSTARRSAAKKPAAKKPAAKGRKPAAKKQVVGPSNAEIREWAVANGVEVNKSGRVPASVREAYQAAHQDAATNN